MNVEKRETAKTDLAAQLTIIYVEALIRQQWMESAKENAVRAATAANAAADLVFP